MHNNLRPRVLYLFILHILLAFFLLQSASQQFWHFSCARTRRDFTGNFVLSSAFSLGLVSRGSDFFIFFLIGFGRFRERCGNITSEIQKCIQK